MASSKITHIEHLFQEVTERFNRTNYRLSAAWVEFEHTRESLQHLRIAYRIALEDQERDRREKKARDLDKCFFD